jgi:hypothetical protein
MLRRVAIVRTIRATRSNIPEDAVLRTSRRTNNNNNNSIIYYLYAESTATRPITDIAQCKYGQRQHKVKGKLQKHKNEEKNNENKEG